MDPVLSSIFPTHKIGSDGFSWWIGQIESGQGQDPKNSGRYRVRIIGTHLKDCNITPSSHLPWAHVMMPVTSPWSDGGTSGSTIGLKTGSWVVGFYLDNDKQKPMIMGSIGHTAGATLLENVEKDPSPGQTCKEFTTFLDPERNPYKHDPVENKENDGTTQVGQAGQIAAAIPGKGPAIFYAAFAEASETNPTGAKVCVELADATCGSEQDLKTGLQNILKDMMKGNQDSGGQLGSYLVGKANGKLTEYVGIGRKYINKAIRLVKSFIARVKGEIVKGIKKGVDKLVKTILYKEVAEKKAEEKGPAATPLDPDLNPKKDEKPKTKKVSRIKFLIDFINEILDDLGCSMEKLTEKISKYITDLLMKYLMQAYQAALCLVDTLVNGILNQIISFIDSALSFILGGLDQLLSIIESPLNLIGGIIKKVFDLLGISCDGPSTKCQKLKKECTECNQEKDDEDWLDKLIESIEDGPLDSSSYVCEEAKQYPNIDSTTVVFIGGIYNNPTPDDIERETQEDFIPDQAEPDIDIVSITNLIRYTSSDVTVTEGEDATFTITRSGNTTLSSSIGIKVVSGSAQEGEDFIRDYDSSVLGFAPNETTKSITFKTFRDLEVEGPQTFLIRLDTRYFPVDYVISYPDGRDFVCTILDESTSDISPTTPSTPGGTTPGTRTPPYIAPTQTNILPYIPSTLNPDTSSPTLSRSFVVFPEKPFYYEGETAVFKILSRNVPVGEVISYTLDIDPSDIVGGQTTGTFSVGENGLSEVTFVLAQNNDNVRIDPVGTIPQTDEDGNFILDEDGNITFNDEEIITNIDDVNETLTFILDETGDRGFITIIGENDGTPSYFVRADKSSVSEGETVIFTITTSNVSNGTILGYQLSGDITVDDIEGKKLSGEFEITNNRSEVQIQIAVDDIIENTKNLVFTVIKEEEDVASTSVTLIGDVEPEEVFVSRTYSVVSDKFEYKEGETIEYTITTTNVTDGTVLQYLLYGIGVSPSDFEGDSTYGQFTVIDNTAKVYIGIKEDTQIEQSESVTFLITGTAAFADVVIIADLDEPDKKDPPKETICVTPPTAGSPITDSKGGIISIPIIDKGCPYAEPPRVIITGAGIGATAIPLLDNTGRVSEIRVTRIGGGYKRNTAESNNLKCVIDSFTLINPGRGYTSPPDVYINGQAGIAEAFIDDQGYVFSVQILDRSIEFSSIPKVTFNGGGGAGASFLPSIVCLDTLEELELNGYAKIGTGKYIDCP